MSLALDGLLRDAGTRFALFAQLPGASAFSEPEIVWLSPRAGTLSPGPADARMYVVDPIDKTPYDERSSPPYAGAVHPPARPDALGHFDSIPVDSRQFLSAHMYGSVRRVMDIWEDYLGGPIDLPFTDTLELVPLVDWSNAHAGPGFIETGFETNFDGRASLFCLNLDVLAHEVGHMILFSELGLPDHDAMTAEFRGFHEAFADIAALVSVLHFETFIDHLLETSHGNLYSLNELNRIGELSSTEQIRLASNAKRMSDVPAAGTPIEQLSQRELHLMSQPLTGALFDLYVEVFEERLLESAAIDPALDALTRRSNGVLDLERIQQGYDAAHARAPALFREALLHARDYLGALLAGALRRMGPHDLTYVVVASAMLRADEEISGGRYADHIVECIRWREIGGP